MSPQSNKQIVTAFLDHLCGGEIDKALDLLHPDASWEIVGQREISGFGGSYDKASLGKLMRRMLGQLEDGLHITLTNALAEGDEVALEATSSGDLKNGRKYRQRYHFRATLKDGKICSGREYLDTHHAWDVWVRP